MPSNDSHSAADQPEVEVNQALLQSLRRKEGNWIAWGEACQQLQQSGYNPQQIFEETGFEPVQQNQIVVAAQVYQSLVSGAAPAEVVSRFDRTGSDTLYELRILSQPQRVIAATIIVDKNIDSEGAHEVAKALKEFSRLAKPPEAFTARPSDAISHYYWKLARQQSDLQMRSRLIAQALRFAEGEAARRQVESLLTDFSISRSRPSPRLPFYRLESAEDQPRIVPIVGKFPLTPDDLKVAPLTDPEGLFQIVKFSGTGAWVALPSWQVVRGAEDPVMILAESEHLPSEAETPEEVLVMVDRAQRQWTADSYFVVDRGGQLQLDWFEDTPQEALLGRVILVLRPKKVLDEDFNKELWQIDE